MAKRIMSVLLTLTFLLTSAFFCSATNTVHANTNQGIFEFYLEMPSETLDADTVEVTVCAKISDLPEDAEITTLQTALTYDVENFQALENGIQVHSSLEGMAEAKDTSSKILFQYEKVFDASDKLLTEGTYELFSVEFSIIEGSFAVEFPFQISENDSEVSGFTQESGFFDLAIIPALKMLYIGERFKVTPSSLTMYVGESVTLNANKSIENFRNWNENIISFSNGKVTALAQGKGTLALYAIGEECYVAVQVLEPDASLSSLTLSNATLSPAFNTGVYRYTATVPYSVEKLNFQAAATDSNAAVQIHNPTLTAGAVTDVTVTVTAGDKTTQKIYTISVTRESPSTESTLQTLSVSNATLSPAFNAGVYSYTTTVPYTVDKLDLSCTVSDSKATVAVNNPTLTVGGTTNIKITVTAEDGVTQQVYTIAVTREKPPYPNAITSSKFTVGATYISKISAETTVSAIKAGINEAQYIKIYRANGTEASATEYVGTGFTVRLFHGNTVKQTLTVIVTGDVNGDGKITGSDYVNVKFDVLNKNKLSGAYSVAADIDGNKKITGTDYVNIKFHVIGKITIQPK
ncbi:MAG: cadherin-like beta sandwich domain-containing protein [Clostridia bacterium]|nr:cadherin-like beta sandwich domain-containing protein [Clostridia bacterium]MBQ7289247.1 cadherin-like beta sandwich domain-containing protein [Clostridia bacterium]